MANGEGKFLLPSVVNCNPHQKALFNLGDCSFQREHLLFSSVFKTTMLKHFLYLRTVIQLLFPLLFLAPSPSLNIKLMLYL